MRRLKFSDLNVWKHSPSRKPLILRGARQVRKTWLLKEFGATEYQDFVYINFVKIQIEQFNINLTYAG